jgi:[protein-PII] uridylyltransferase
MTTITLVEANHANPALDIEQWRLGLARDRETLRIRFLAKPAVADNLRRHSAIIDRQLREVWHAHGLPPDVALIAVGGYGRGQLFPSSDIDILIALPCPANENLQEQLRQLVSLWWDIGLEVGHSVRTVDECVDMARHDITVQTTLLEARLLSGNRELYRQFMEQTFATIVPQQFMQAKMLEQQRRHARYDETNLEPNIKEKAGGLRDLNNILWIARATGAGKSWADLVRRGIIEQAESRDIQRHERVLQSLRVRLHYLAGRREDRLLFDYQTELARQLRLVYRSNRLASEKLMQRYYRTAKAVTQIGAVVIANLRSRASGSRNVPLRPLNARFGVRGELLAIRNDSVYERAPTAILETFQLMQQHPELKGIGPNTLRSLWRARKLIGPTFRRNQVHREQFMQILRSDTRVIRELRRMSEYGILGRYLPAFGRIVGQMQHDLYHVYTVDEHILKVVRNLRRFAVPELAHEFPLCSRLFSEFARPEVLYVAGLFHDIAKGRGGDHSTLGKADALRFCRAHGLTKEDCTLVTWLVEQHLVMSQTAQKQDLSDPNVIRLFSENVVDKRRLVALYLLTVADIRGTSPKVWNAWKNRLLEDLYVATRRLLAGDNTATEYGHRARQDHARTTLRLYAISDEAIEHFWSKLDIPYFLRHDAQEVAWHTRLLNQCADSPIPIVKARLSTVGEGLQVMVYVIDQNELVARICSFFESMRYTIHEARIYTTRHGYALDTFQVQDPENSRPDYRDLMSYIEFELRELLRLKSPLPPLTQPRLNRQLRHFPITPHVDIQQDERGDFHVLSVIAGDRPGLLSRITRVFVSYGINLHIAKANTMRARVEDTFLITGETLNNARKVALFERDLIEQLKTQ